MNRFRVLGLIEYNGGLIMRCRWQYSITPYNTSVHDGEAAKAA